MEVNSKIKCIKCLNRNSLIEFLIEQKFRTEAQILKSRDIDGERFLNFTELDLVQWRLTANQKKIILNCRSQLLGISSQTMSPKPTIPKGSNPPMRKVKAKTDIERKLEAVLDPNKNRKPNISSIRPPRPLPAPPRETNCLSEINIDQHYDIPKRLTRQSLQYVDMNQGKSLSVEPSEDYIDMNSKPLCRSAPKIPDTSKPNFNQTDFHQVTLPQHPHLHTDTEGSKTNLNPYLGEHVQDSSQGSSRPSRKLEIKPKPQTPEVEEYLEPKPMIFSTSDSPFYSSPQLDLPTQVHRSPSQKRSKCPKLPEPPKLPPLFPRNPPSSEHNSSASDEEDRIYEMEPDFKPKISTRNNNNSVTALRAPQSRNKNEPLTKNSKKPSIQDIPLPPIPNEIDVVDVNASTSLVPSSNKFHVPIEKNRFILPQPNEKPKPLPKPLTKNKPKSSNETRPSFESNNDFDLENLPLPPPGFLDSPEINVSTKNKGKEESELPRPPIFNHLFEQEQIRCLQDLIPEDDTSSSDEESFNLNNFAFYRNTDRKGAKQLLQKMENLENGVFLLRPSTNESYFLGLTIFHDKHFYNMGLHKDVNGKFYCESFIESETVKFKTLNGFVNYYKNNALTVKNRDGRVIELYLKHSLPKDVF